LRLKLHGSMELLKQTVWYSSLLSFLKWKHNKRTKYS
jgi:hypothetical protein